jgi:hypothetical protein
MDIIESMKSCDIRELSVEHEEGAVKNAVWQGTRR